MLKHTYLVLALLLGSLPTTAFCDKVPFSFVDNLLSGKARQETIFLTTNNTTSDYALPKGRIFITGTYCYTAPIPEFYSSVPVALKITMSILKANEDSTNKIWIAGLGSPEANPTPREQEVIHEFTHPPYVNNRDETYLLRFNTPYRSNACRANLVIYP